MSARARILDEPGALRVVISAPGHRGLAVFLAVWLCGWALGEVAVVRALFSAGGPPLEPASGGPASTPLFLALWLLGWTLGGAVALAAFVIAAFGRETVHLDGQTLVLARTPLPWPRTRRFAFHDLRRLRVDPEGGGADDALPQPGGRGSLAFDLAAQTHRFGQGLEAAEATAVLHAITQRFGAP